MTVQERVAQLKKRSATTTATDNTAPELASATSSINSQHPERRMHNLSRETSQSTQLSATPSAAARLAGTSRNVAREKVSLSQDLATEELPSVLEISSSLEVSSSQAVAVSSSSSAAVVLQQSVSSNSLSAEESSQPLAKRAKSDVTL